MLTKMSTRLFQKAIAQKTGRIFSVNKFNRFNRFPTRLFTQTTDVFLDRENVRERVVRIIREIPALYGKKELVISEKTHFTKDLGLDGLDQAEVVVALEQEFDFVIEEDIADKVLTVKMAVDIVVKSPTSI